MSTKSERAAILEYLGDLRDHNSKDWFEANRGRYEEVRATFLGMVGEILSAFGPVEDLGGIDVKACVFRINRDVRFGKDKTPYKSTMSALIGREGRKSGVRGYYFHLEPDGNSMLAGGLHSPEPGRLSAVRDAIAANSRGLRKIVSAPDFVRLFGEISGERLKTAPAGFAKDHPDIELLRLKRLLAVHGLSDRFVATGDVVGRAIEAFSAMRPFLLWLEKATG
jgi:uncharacterized protein (TIGR02453 family)